MIESELPIQAVLPDLKKKLQDQLTLILEAPPGAGKSTVLPLQLLQESWLAGKKVLMLEPRRLAARAVAHRMAWLLGEKVGQTVGYRVRFENKVSKDTRLEVLTEGILTRMLGQDNTLEGVGLVIFDEFHERSLHADLALALCREVQAVLRDDLRLLIMSATLDGNALSSMLGNAPVLKSQGRQYPISLQYLPQEQRGVPGGEAIAQQVTKAVRKALAEEEGDVLVFLPGLGEIRRVEERLQEAQPELSLHPLYGDLPQAEQQAALLPHPHGKRKVVLATSIAETSLTIEGIRVVVDSGYSRVPRFEPRSGLTRLETEAVTRATADQRAGRAGRLGPGVAYRLWSEGMHQHLLAQRQPEIMEADLAPMVLELAGWGIADLRSLNWVTPPTAGAVAAALELLHQLGALENGRITDKGREMLKLPTHPRLAHLLLEGKEANMAALAADVAALLEERDPLQKEAGADLSLRVEALRRARSSRRGHAAERGGFMRIELLVSNWCRLFSIAPGTEPVADQEVGKLIAAAYPERIARRDSGNRYRLANGRAARLPEADPLGHEEWLAIAHMDAGKGEGKIFLAAPLNPKDLRALAKEQEVVAWDTGRGELVANKELRIGDVLLESKPLGAIPEEERLRLLCGAVKADGENLLSWTEDVKQWQARVLSLRHWRPGEAWPDVSTPALLQEPEQWLAPYLAAVRRQDDFRRLDLLQILQSSLSWELQQRLAQLAPLSLEVPTGSNIRLEYRADGSPPILAVRLQEMFGLLETPVVNEGRTRVLLHLLSPGYRPVQVTQDLHSFWENTYAAVRKDLRGRYPKHHWPEDPWTAEAVRGVKRKH
ncbi:ATP-dependent helicase HrpB [Cesiribacter sp. SM1]|uniref:ATP-dependent helicase HrpB n=1 Tax=Cesiribacter sp. SM1 TaxID=2861196 RepID=UPI001CD78655|nr:ATP-dependent helicase HrpB [Cesiribacter sp. SM1]